MLPLLLDLADVKLCEFLINMRKDINIYAFVVMILDMLSIFIFLKFDKV
jgi:hypothetical protein